MLDYDDRNPGMYSIHPVSVLMPAYNVEEYIGEAIESILGQSFADFEFIILDDCSNDCTWNIIQRYAMKDRRIVAIRNKEHGGIAPSRNNLIALARGKYVVWQDADDVSMAKRIEHQYLFMEDHEGVGICSGSIKFMCHYDHDGYVRIFPPSDAILRERIFCYSPVVLQASIVRRALMERVGGFDESLPQAEDLDMSIRIGMCSRFANLDEIVLRYRYDENSLSYKKVRENITYTLVVRKRARALGYEYHFFDRLVNVMTQIAVFLPIPPDYLVAYFDAFRSFDLKYSFKKIGHV
jgi:glycosyltransferase involved in cell wall biosynthesis